MRSGTSVPLAWIALGDGEHGDGRPPADAASDAFIFDLSPQRGLRRRPFVFAGRRSVCAFQAFYKPTVW
jgi:hypothetical protein